MTANDPVRQSSEDYIGIDSLYYASITADTASGLTYGTPKLLAPVAQLSKTTASDTVKSYYDNAPYRAITSEDSDELTLVTPALDLATLADITGKAVDATSLALVDSGDPAIKYFAILARAQLSDGTWRYFVWNKVSFSIPDETIDTKKDTVTLNGQTLKATAIRTTFKYTIGGATSGVKRIVADARDNKVKVADWFTAVPTPTSIPMITP